MKLVIKMGTGFMGKFAHVDLTTGTIGLADIEESAFKKFLGGKGISTKLMWDHLKKLEAKGINIAEFDALSPDNILIFATGPGTAVAGFPSSGRHHVNTLKAPLTGSIGSSNSGGNWGAYLKKAGYDGIIVFDLSGQQIETQAFSGVAQIEFASEIAGEYKIRTVNEYVKNGEVIIHV